MKLRVLACCVLVALTINAFSQENSNDYLSCLLNRNSLPFDTAISVTTNAYILSVEENAWKSWRTVENYSFGKDRGSLPMIADLNSLHPYFRDKIVELINICRTHGIQLEVVESFRTHSKQSEYFGMGRKYTRSKGGKSKHQYGLAVDLVPIVNGNPEWDNHYLWKKIGMAGEKLGLRWGGRWRTPYDPAHFEWSGGINTYHLANGIQPFIPKSKTNLYPCLNEEIERLQKYWEAWETEQAILSSNQSAKRIVQGAVGQ